MKNYHLLPLSFENSGQQSILTPVLIHDEEDCILVDCGYPGFTSLLDEALAKHQLSLQSLTKLIVSHHDIDHMGALAAIKRSYPQIDIIAHEQDAPYINGTCKSLRLEQAESTLDALPEAAKPGAKAFISYLQTMEHAPVERIVADREILPWCGGIEIIHTPGHMPGHISLYLPSSKTIIAADAVVIENGVLDIANPQFTLDMDQAIASVERLGQYDAEHLICYHGGLYEGDVKQALRQLLQSYT